MTSVRHSSWLVLALATVTRTATAFSVAPTSYETAAGYKRVSPTAFLRSRWGTPSRARLDLRSYEGGDFPSDVGDGAASAAIPAVLADDNPKLRETMKREILSIAATSNR